MTRIKNVSVTSGRNATKHDDAQSPDERPARRDSLSTTLCTNSSIVQSEPSGESAPPAQRKGRLFVLSGPSGVGKDAVLSRMRESKLPWHFTVTATTRPQRPSEVDGVDYFFYTESQFTAMVLNDEFLEHAEVYGNLYGVPKGPVNRARNDGIDVIIKADIQGAATIRKSAPGAVLIFLDPPDIPELTRRLTERMTESPDALKVRIATARREMEEGSKFDHRVVNHSGRLDEAVAEIKRIISEAQAQPSEHPEHRNTLSSGE